ncbi:competence protein ComEC [Singulisphaera sp. GP187]|uniref:ComEC/Rec2 family competence protein n=1 Tax=Singulisphaera sp. GP187 TaxID=1882752 RepID=UPI00092C624F|nr:ComEC/Rec2 family competence protein [Singulisphaera sp. GP187]SIO29120.1 competence protein ComEC [Singulisphaera sp. GP187]
MSYDPDRRSRVLLAPLVPVALAFVVGIVLDREFERWGTDVWAGLALVGVMIAALGRDHQVPAVAGLVLAIVGLGGGRHHAYWSDLMPDDLARVRGLTDSPRPVWVRGVIWDVRGPRLGESVGSSATTRAVLAVTALCDGRVWRPAQGRAQLIVVGDRSDLAAGHGIEAVGVLSAIAGPLNPGEFDYRHYLRAQRIRLRLAVDGPDGVWADPAAGTWIGTDWLGRVRTWSYVRLVAGLNPNVAPLAAALLLGRREGVDPDVNDAFARTGTTHLLAISGLHLQVLAGVLWFVFRFLGLGRRSAFLALALTTIAYALLVGLAPSVVRSAAMTVAACLAGFLDRSVRSANNLSLAALITLWLNPADLFDVGCQLSFLAIAAIFWGVTPTTNLLRHAYYALTFRIQGPGSPLDVLERSLEPWWLAQMRRWPVLVTPGLIVSTIVWLAALPLVALRFHVISPIGVLLNLPLIPLTSIALMASGLSLGLSAIWDPLGGPPAWVCARTLGWTEYLVRWGASRSWGHAFVPGPSLAWVLVTYGLLGFATVAGVRRWSLWRIAWGLLAGWVMLGLVWTSMPRREGRLETEVLAVGHGLAVIIQTLAGGTIVYDCGRMHDPSVGRRIVAPALWARGVSHIDAVILSHADADHYNGLPDLLERFSIAEVCVPPGFASPANPGAVQLLETVRTHGVPIRVMAEGEQWESAGARFSVWHPPESFSPGSSDNARSIVLALESAGRHLLLTGDLEREGLTRLLDRPAFPLDAILAPHHGGRSANPESLYTWARPGLVVVSQRPPAVGTRDPLEALEPRGIPLLRTWQRGAIRLRWEPDRLAARGFLDENRSPARSPVEGLMMNASSWQRGLVSLAGFLLGLGTWLVLVIAKRERL